MNMFDVLLWWKHNDIYWPMKMAVRVFAGAKQPRVDSARKEDDILLRGRMTNQNNAHRYIKKYNRDLKTENIKYFIHTSLVYC